MKSFMEFQLAQVEEDVGITLAKELLPKKVLHWLKRVLHGDKYKEVLKLQRSMMKDKSRTISASQALIKAAQIHGIKPKEIMKVMDKETRYA